MGVNSNDIILDWSSASWVQQIMMAFSQKWIVNSPTDNDDKKKSKQASNETNQKWRMIKMNQTKLRVGLIAKTKLYPEPNHMSWVLTITLLNLKIASNRKGLTKYFSPSSHAYVNELSRRVLHRRQRSVQETFRINRYFIQNYWHIFYNVVVQLLSAYTNGWNRRKGWYLAAQLL
jgi:hypothetical protein